MQCVQYGMCMRPYLSSKTFNLSMKLPQIMYHGICYISYCEKCAISIHMHALWTEYVHLWMYLPLLQNIQFVHDMYGVPQIIDQEIHHKKNAI